MMLSHIVEILILAGIFEKCITVSKDIYSCKQDTCYYLEHSIPDEPLFGKTITDRTRFIITDYIHDFGAFSRTKVKMYQNEELIIFYECPNHEKVSVFNRFNYTSVEQNFKRHIFNRHGPVSSFSINSIFQMCLTSYCEKFHNHEQFTWKLQCKYKDILYFAFTLTLTVTNFCLESITYAVLNSSNLYDLNTSLFFKYAINLVRLTIVAPKNITAIKCDLFRDIIHLKLLHLANVDLVSTNCIFQYNPQLVRISNSSARLWNMCNGTFDLVDNNESENVTITNNIVTIVPYANFWLSFFVLLSIYLGVVVIVLGVRYKFYKPPHNQVVVANVEEISLD